MTLDDWLQFLLVVAALAVTTPLLGGYLARVYAGGDAPLDRLFSPVERAIYRACGIDPRREQRWNRYAASVLAFSFVSVVVLYALERLQGHLPLNPAHLAGVPPALAWNTAVSFVTNTNWQNYAGETTMSQLTQMSGLAVQNFVSAGVGIVVAVALIRGLVRRQSPTIGNFFVDLTRTVVRVLLPLSFVAALALVAFGVIQDFGAAHAVHTVTGTTQLIPSSPVASQEAIKELGTNGGGVFNANSAHPFENPSGASNLFEIVLLLAIPFALAWTFGVMAKNRRQGGAVLAAMVVLWAGLALSAMYAEAGGNANLPAHVDQRASTHLVGGNLTGKELRLGASASALMDSSATSTSTGTTAATNDSFTALGGGALLFNMMLGEVSPGGVGSGLYGMLVLALVAVFIAGLMIGRTPEYLGKRIEAVEMRLVALYLLLVPAVALVFAGVSASLHVTRSSLLNPGPHGLSELLYAFVSTSNNNGSAFAGLNGNTTYFNTTLGVAMFLGRFALIVLVLALAGSLAQKRPSARTVGTLATDTPTFAGLLTVVCVILVGLSYFPVLALGPLAEHFTHLA